MLDRDAAIRFVKHDTDRLDAELMSTELGPTLVTTPKQTVLDLASRPGLGGVEDEARAAVIILLSRTDPDLLEQLTTA